MAAETERSPGWVPAGHTEVGIGVSPPGGGNIFGGHRIACSRGAIPGAGRHEPPTLPGLRDTSAGHRGTPRPAAGFIPSGGKVHRQWA